MFTNRDVKVMTLAPWELTRGQQGDRPKTWVSAGRLCDSSRATRVLRSGLEPKLWKIVTIASWLCWDHAKPRRLVTRDTWRIEK